MGWLDDPVVEVSKAPWEQDPVVGEEEPPKPNFPLSPYQGITPTPEPTNIQSYEDPFEDPAATIEASKSVIPPPARTPFPIPLPTPMPKPAEATGTPAFKPTAEMPTTQPLPEFAPARALGATQKPFGISEETLPIKQPTKETKPWTTEDIDRMIPITAKTVGKGFADVGKFVIDMMQQGAEGNAVTFDAINWASGEKPRDFASRMAEGSREYAKSLEKAGKRVEEAWAYSPQEQDALERSGVPGAIVVGTAQLASFIPMMIATGGEAQAAKLVGIFAKKYGTEGLVKAAPILYKQAPKFTERLIGNTLSMGEIGAVQAEGATQGTAEQKWAAALKSGLSMAAMGATGAAGGKLASKVTQKASEVTQRAVQGAVQSGVFGGFTAAEGGSPTDIISAAALGFGFGVKEKPYGSVKQLYDNATASGFKVAEPKVTDNLETYANREGKKVLYETAKSNFEEKLGTLVNWETLKPEAKETGADYSVRLKEALDKASAQPPVQKQLPTPQGEPNAESAGKETQKGSQVQGPVEGADGSLRLRDNAQAGMVPVPGEETKTGGPAEPVLVPPQPTTTSAPQQAQAPAKAPAKPKVEPIAPVDPEAQGRAMAQATGLDHVGSEQHIELDQHGRQMIVTNPKYKSPGGKIFSMPITATPDEITQESQLRDRKEPTNEPAPSPTTTVPEAATVAPAQPVSPAPEAPLRGRRPDGTDVARPAEQGSAEGTGGDQTGRAARILNQVQEDHPELSKKLQKLQGKLIVAKKIKTPIQRGVEIRNKHGDLNEEHPKYTEWKEAVDGFNDYWNIKDGVDPIYVKTRSQFTPEEFKSQLKLLVGEVSGMLDPKMYKVLSHIAERTNELDGGSMSHDYVWQRIKNSQMTVNRKTGHIEPTAPALDRYASELKKPEAKEEQWRASVDEYIKTGAVPKSVKMLHADVMEVLKRVPAKAIGQAAGLETGLVKKAIQDIKAGKKGGKAAETVRRTIADNMSYGETVEEAVNGFTGNGAPAAEGPKYSRKEDGGIDYEKEAAMTGEEHKKHLADLNRESIDRWNKAGSKGFPPSLGRNTVKEKTMLAEKAGYVLPRDAEIVINKPLKELIDEAYPQKDTPKFSRKEDVDKRIGELNALLKLSPVKYQAAIRAEPSTQTLVKIADKNNGGDVYLNEEIAERYNALPHEYKYKHPFVEWKKDMSEGKGDVSPKETTQLDIFGGEKPISQLEREEESRIQKGEIKRRQAETKGGEADLSGLPMFEDQDMEGSQQTLRFSRKRTMDRSNAEAVAEETGLTYHGTRGSDETKNPLHLFTDTRTGTQFKASSKGDVYRAIADINDGIAPEKTVSNESGLKFSRKDRTPEQEAQLARLKAKAAEIERRLDMTPDEIMLEENNKLVDFLRNNGYTMVNTPQGARYVQGTREDVERYWAEFDRNSGTGITAYEGPKAFGVSQTVDRGTGKGSEEVTPPEGPSTEKSKGSEKPTFQREEDVGQNDRSEAGSTRVRKDSQREAFEPKNELRDAAAGEAKSGRPGVSHQLEEQLQLEKARNQSPLEPLKAQLSKDDSRNLGRLVDYTDENLFIVEPNEKQRLELSLAEKVSGRKVYFIGIDGVYSTGDGIYYKGNIYIDKDTTQPVVRVIFHETIHALNNQSPKDVDNFYNIFADNMTEEGRKEAENYAEKWGVSFEYAVREKAGDYAGDVMGKSKFWEDLANKFPDTFRKFVADLVRQFKKLMDLIPHNPKWEKILKDHKAVYESLLDAYAAVRGKDIPKASEGMAQFMMKAFHGSQYKEERATFSRKAEKDPNQLDLFSTPPPGEVGPSTKTIFEDTKTKEQLSVVDVKQVNLFGGEKSTLEEAPAKGEIQDFGQKIGGARKDVYSEFKDRFADAKELSLAEEPFSKTWPEPDYEKMIESGTDPWLVGWIRAMRDEVPTKPQKSWRLSRWVEQAKMLRDVAGKLLSGDIKKQRLLDMLNNPEYRTLKEYVGGRAELYEQIGHGASLKGVTLRQHHYSMYKGEKNVSKWQIERGARSTAMSNMPSELGVGNTKQEAIDDFKSKLDQLTPTEQKGRKVEFLVYTRRDTKKSYVVKKLGSQRYLELKEFDNPKDAFDYRRNHQAELEAQLDRLKELPNERREFNRERIGKDHRQGKDVTPEMFQEAFGFRGVEFGNWVNNDERRDNLNRAYDSLYDLAGILNIPTKAISLNGELGLGFGSRGHGGKNPPAAHYEADRIVINLTKKNGPGSLAHEWWHAFDNYISRNRGKRNAFMTQAPSAMAGDVTRPELIGAFKRVVDSIEKTKLRKRSKELDATRSKDYWSETIEMAARSFENYVIKKLEDMGATNDYLANVAGSKEYVDALGERMVKGKPLTEEDIYPYLLPEEIKAVKPEFDNLFKTIKTKETDQGTMMFSRKESTDFENPPVNKKDYITWSEIHKSILSNYFDSEGNQIAVSNEVPAKQSNLPIGKWRIDDMAGIHGHEIQQLQMVDPNDLIDVEEPEKYRRNDVDKYEQWRKEGLVPPPIEVVKQTNGKRGLKIVDGHRRAAAAKRLGMKVPAWVAPIGVHPEGLKDGATGEAQMVGMTFEMLDEQKPLFSRKEPSPERAPADTFFSPTLRAVQGLKQEKGTGEQMFAMIAKTPGVKEAEWKWMGLDDFLKGKPSVTKQEIEDFVRQNQVEIKEVKKGGVDNFIQDDDVGRSIDVKEGLERINKGLPVSFKYSKGRLIQLDKPESLSKDSGYREDIEGGKNELLTGGVDIENYELTGDVKRMMARESLPDTKFGNYVLPGGENYREVLLTLPMDNEYTKYRDELEEKYGLKGARPSELEVKLSTKELDKLEELSRKSQTIPQYKSSHWSEPNVIAHVRLNDRTGPDGERVLFVEEIQSDWAREAREKGVVSKKITELPEGYTIEKGKRFSNNEPQFVIKKPDGSVSWVAYTDNEKEAVAEQLKVMNAEAYQSGVPNQPFLKNWEELTLKRVLRMAAEEGYDRVAWINGEQTAGRYDLSKQLDALEIEKNLDGTYTVTGLVKGQDTPHLFDSRAKENDLAGIIGKDHAQKVIDAKLEHGDGGMEIAGENLKIGGEWASALYDRMIPKFLEKYGKKWGTKVESIPLGTISNMGKDTEAFVQIMGDEYAVRTRDGEVENTFPTRAEAQNLADEINEKSIAKTGQQSISITPEMRESVLEEGQPLFSRKEPIEPPQSVEEVYQQATQSMPDMVKKLRGDTKSFKEFRDRIAADVFVPLSTRLKKIGEPFKQAMRKFEFHVGRQEGADSRKLRPLLDATKKMSVKDRIVFDLALKNGDGKKINEIVSKYKIDKQFDAAREMLNDIHRRAVGSGFDINFINDFWPRSVLNPQGLLMELSGMPEWGIIEDQIHKEEKILKRPLNEAEQAKIANQFIARPDRLLQAPGHLKERTVGLIDNELDVFYDDSMSAIVKYTHEMNQAIETRKFFNFKKEDVDAVEQDLFLGEPKTSSRITDIDGGIGRYVLTAIQEGRMKPDQQDELVGLLKARFNYRPSGRIVQKIKELGYITSMGSGFSSFITQLGDLTWAYYVAGPIRASAAFGKALAGKSALTKEDLGLERIAEEFRTGRGFGKALKHIFDWTLLTKMDNIGKEALINGALSKFRAQAKSGNKEFANKLLSIFGEETGTVIDDLKAGRDTENVKYLLFNRLLDFQPMTLSEMPLKYLNSPNGRLLYMLKTFTIKQIDAFRNEATMVIGEGIKTGDKMMVLRGTRNLIYLAALFIMANAGADALKDWLFGRKPSFEDKVWDNILRLFGLSRFIAWEARRSGPVKAFWKLVSPPADIIEAPLKDFWTFKRDDDKGVALKIKNMESWKMVPFLGKHYYWWFGGGRARELDKRDRNSPYAKLKREIRRQRAKAKRIAKKGLLYEKQALKKGDKEQAERIKRETKENVLIIENDLKKYVAENGDAAIEYRKKQMEEMKKKMEDEL